MLRFQLDKSNYDWYCNPENMLFFELYIAYLEARISKRETMDEQKFEMNDMENLRQLQKTILNRTYQPTHGVVHIIKKPVVREIFVAHFRDRIVHHYIHDNVYEWWDKHFIYDSYACREHKGGLLGISRLYRFIQSASNNYQSKVYVFKFDIAGFFMHLPRKKLYEQAIWGLDQQFVSDKGWRYQTLRFLWKQIIFDDPCAGVVKKEPISDWDLLPPSKSLFNQPPGQGIVIGNLTSQLLSNVYLDMLDRYIMFDLGFKRYGRYVDDFYIVVSENELDKAKRCLPAIITKLESLGLSLHPTKTKIVEASHGVEFLGAVVYPGRIIPGKRLAHNFRQAMFEIAAGKKNPDSIYSYWGHVKGFNSDKLITRVFRDVGWEYKL